MELIGGAIAFLLSLVVWTVLAPLVLLVLVAQWRILNKAGLSGWWSLTVIVPPLWFLLIWVFAFARWPAVDDASGVRYYAPGGRRGPPGRA